MGRLHPALPQHTLPKTPIQATGSALNLLKVYGVRSLTGDGLEGKKLETEKPVKKLHVINVQVRSKKLEEAVGIEEESTKSSRETESKDLTSACINMLRTVRGAKCSVTLAAVTAPTVHAAAMLQ